jgi:hypothetical protein
VATIKEKRRKIDQEIEAGRNDIRTDKLDISYGELANLYANKELIIRPEFQRLFRWSSTQRLGLSSQSSWDSLLLRYS